jgi:threonylcarbamoyladenosine tRNA methylthiotransferase MtaB
MNVFLQSFGCKVNAVETDSMAALLVQHGWTVCQCPEEAEAVIVNSCTVTASGDHRMRTALRRLRGRAPHAVIVLTGCFVQAFPEQAASLEEADILVGTKERSRIPALLEEFMAQQKPVYAVSEWQCGERFESLPQGGTDGHTRAFLKIQDGCNRFCAYCIIPYARGRCRSRPMEEISAQAMALREQSFRELVLCGINLACYGEETQWDIADAVSCCTQAGFERVRLGSLEPDGLTDSVLERLAANPSFCPQFHISLQSGCDRTLSAMHRNYTCAEYAALLQKIRNLFPHCSVTTDIMTGFPGETEEDFSETLRFAEKMSFSRIHIFRYSRRPGTKADTLSGQVPESVKKERADRLAQVARSCEKRYLHSCIGSTVKVLFEREKTEGFHNGHAPDYTAVLVPAVSGEGSLRNRILDVELTEVRDGKCFGRLCDPLPF